MTPVDNPSILYIDDDPDDIQMLKEAILTINPQYKILEAADGSEGYNTLQTLKQNNALPCLIVLDINMPQMDGRETFVKIKADSILSNIPIVVFSTSKSSVDKLFFQEKTTEYMTKPFAYSHLLEVAKRLLSYCAH